MPGPPPFEASRERKQDTHGTASSSSDLVRLPPGPGASLPQDLAEDPSVAHTSASYYTGDVVMYSEDRTMTINDRNNLYQVKKVACPRFELQPGVPSDRCVSIHFPRTTIGKEKLLRAHRTAVKKEAC